MILNQMFVVQHQFNFWTFSLSVSHYLMKIRGCWVSRRESCGYRTQLQLFEPVDTNIQYKINNYFVKRVTFLTFPCFGSISNVSTILKGIGIILRMNRKPSNQMSLWKSNILIFFNGKLYFFLSFLLLGVWYKNHGIHEIQWRTTNLNYCIYY